MEVKKVAEEWEIWDEKKEATRLEEKAKELVPEKFHRWIKVFRKKQLERMPMRKVWDHAIDVIKGQKWTVILGMLWLARHNPEID